MKIGIIKERKSPPDRRVVLAPQACKELLAKFDALSIVVEPSDIRVFPESAYEAQGIPVTTAMESCDVLLGVKEVPIENLIPNKKYFFFSHTIKKQPYNRDLLQAVLEKNIELYDHEVIVGKNELRLVAFGRYAGIVGAFNAFRTFGLKSKLFDLPKADNYNDQHDLIFALQNVKDQVPNIKIVLTGKGRVSNGSKEMLDGMGIREVDVEAYLTQTFDEPVYVQIDVLDYNKRKDGKVIDMYDFFNNPSEYESDFMRFAEVSDMYIAGHFYGDGAPFIFTREDAKKENFKIKVVADVSCDIDGPVASTIRPSTIADPIYGYNAATESEDDFNKEEVIAVMAVDNLPCELPNDASIGFGESFSKHVIPAFFNGDADGVLERARMTQNGKLTERFSYLQDYVDGE